MGPVRFVRVPPYESWANWTNFCNSWENGAFFGVKSVKTVLVVASIPLLESQLELHLVQIRSLVVQIVGFVSCLDDKDFVEFCNEL